MDKVLRKGTIEKMDDIVFRMNYVKNNNQLEKLKREVKKKDDSINQYAQTCKNLVEAYKTQNDIKMDKLTERIVDLENQNKKLTSERNFYKHSLNRVPKFFLKIFGAKSKALGTGKESR